MEHAESLLPDDDTEAYTQGLMDLGATVCTRARPGCAVCPIGDTCVALREQMIDTLPTPRPPKQRRIRYASVLVIEDANGAVLLEPRPPVGIWGGLLSLPELERDATHESIVAAINSRYGLHVTVHEALGNIRHEFTHYTYVMQPVRVQVTGTSGVANETLRAVSAEELESAPLPAPIRRLLLHLAHAALV